MTRFHDKDEPKTDETQAEGVKLAKADEAPPPDGETEKPKKKKKKKKKKSDE
jgi:hypothetical protein